MKVLFEDNHLLVVEKAAGLLTQASGTDEANLEDEARAWIKRRYAKPGNVFLHVVHRLDRPASGVVLMARTSKALSRLNAAMRAKETRKEYLVIVCGCPSVPEATLEHYMVHREHCAEVASRETPGAAMGRLHYKVLKSSNELTLVHVQLETGRYHQIRLQLATIGCPILGDTRYGGNPWRYSGQIALHHHRLVFPHPVSKEYVTVVTSVPASWPLQLEQ